VLALGGGPWPKARHPKLTRGRGADHAPDRRRHDRRSRPIASPSSPSNAFADLLPELRRSARRLSRSAEDADDLVQETLLRVWARMAMTAQGGSDAAPVSDLRAYAFATLRNRAKRRSPSHLSDEALVETLAAPPDTAPAHLAMRDALAALDALPSDQARLLRMRALEGRSYAEIAARTGLPLGTVTSRLARGRAALRAKLGLPRGASVSDLFRAD
jgi:RNA polymerase sigma-70 factor (ECF subfamily)